MADMAAFMNAMKRQAVNAVEAAGPVNILYGTVIGVAPVRIQVDQETVLQPGELVLSRNVTDYTAEVTVEWETKETSGGSGEASFSPHSHSLSGRKRITVHHGLKAGEKVVLIQMKGGQRFVVLDRVVGV